MWVEKIFGFFFLKFNPFLLEKEFKNIFSKDEEPPQFDLEDDGFSHEYNQRLIEEYEGEKERGSHEENINKRHDYLKLRLDKANAVRKTKNFNRR